MIAAVAELARNDQLAEQFDLLADLMELEGSDGFRISAYRRAAARIRETPTSVAQLALDGKAVKLQDIGKTIEAKIVEIVEDGEIHALTKRKLVVPAEVATFMRLPGLGPKTARRIWQELGITTVAALQAAAEAEQLRGHAGIGAGTEAKILTALAQPKATAGPQRALLGTTLPKLRAVVEVLREHPASVEVSLAGSARRMRETVRDLDIIATATDPKALVDYFCALRWVVDVAARGSTKATVVSHDGLRFDLRVVPPESYGNLLQHFTGSKDHNVALREDAVRRGFSVSEYSVTIVETGEEHSFATEEEVYRFLGYRWIAPELRENGGELAAARLDAKKRGELPDLVELADLRGDLHTHTTWSDGKDSLEDMLAAAKARGYAYYAICDHSQRLRGDLLKQQSEQIDALQELVRPLQILKGIEVNVRPDGTLDVSDEDLASRDWVVASVHSRFDHDATERVLAAMESPYVDCVGHLTNRRIGKRPPAPVDVERVIAKAAETGTFLELNSQPDRLDLSDVNARAAREAGVKVVIDSDGHQIGALDYVELGVGQARRAWLTKDDVLNTRTWKQIQKLQKQRA
ncbi:MAG: DNA polymerase/3'-5' exonuclease PolX [Actinobacteria bacterium]|nr:DNA polymerase/3'-5' exonuclease PolX [Actinomycetota bacterium]